MQATTMSESQFKRQHFIALDRKNIEEKGVLPSVSMMSSFTVFLYLYDYGTVYLSIRVKNTIIVSGGIKRNNSTSTLQSLDAYNDNKKPFICK